MLVPNEICLAEGIYDLAVLREIGVAALLSLCIGLCAILLLFHQTTEALFINLETGF